MADYDSKKYQIQNYDKAKWEEYERVELAWFAQDARDCHTSICRKLDFMTLHNEEDILKRISELRTEIAKSKTIRDDWDRLNEHMETNPTIKEGWEALMMAIRLTEDED